MSHKTYNLNYIRFIREIDQAIFVLLIMIAIINAVKMCSDSQGLSSIPSDLLVYVLRILKM